MRLRGSAVQAMNPRRIQNREAAGRDADEFTERLVQRMREDASKKPKAGIHLIGERGVRTWCQIALTPGLPMATADSTSIRSGGSGHSRPLESAAGSIRGVIRIADTRDQATCEECVELDRMRQLGIANGTYRHPLDAKADAELGEHRPPTLGT
jgi:hypothetical protein